MKKEIKYKNAPAAIGRAIGQAEIIEDFLPPPEKLVVKSKNRKVTINLSEESLDYFKKTAKRLEVSYQLMIKELLDRYVKYYRLRPR